MNEKIFPDFTVPAATYYYNCVIYPYGILLLTLMHKCRSEKATDAQFKLCAQAFKPEHLSFVVLCEEWSDNTLHAVMYLDIKQMSVGMADFKTDFSLNANKGFVAMARGLTCLALSETKGQL